MSTLEERLNRQLAKGKDENSFLVKNLRRQIEAEKSGKGETRGVKKGNDSYIFLTLSAASNSALLSSDLAIGFSLGSN